MSALPFSEWSRKEKDDFAEKRMNEMKLKNERAKQRHAEVEQDRLKAEAQNSSITSFKIEKKERSDQDKVEAVPKYQREWDQGKCDPDSEDWGPPDVSGLRLRGFKKDYPDKQPVQKEEKWRNAPNINRTGRGSFKKPFVDYQRNEVISRPEPNNLPKRSGNDATYKSFHKSRFSEENFSNVERRSSSPNHSKPSTESVKCPARTDNYQVWRDVEISDVQNKQSRVEKWVKSLNASRIWDCNEDTVTKEYYPSEGNDTNSQYDMPKRFFDSDKYSQTRQFANKEKNVFETQNIRGRYDDNVRNNSFQVYSRGRGRGRKDFTVSKTGLRFDNKISKDRFNNSNPNRFRIESNDYGYSRNWQEADHVDRVKTNQPSVSIYSESWDGKEGYPPGNHDQVKGSKTSGPKYSNFSEFWEDVEDSPPHDDDKIKCHKTPDANYSKHYETYEKEYPAVVTHERGKTNHLKDVRSSGSSTEQNVWYGKEHANSKSCDNANWNDISIENTLDNKSSSKTDQKNKFNKRSDFNSGFQAKGRYEDERRNYSASSRNNLSTIYQRTQYSKNSNNLHFSRNKTEASDSWRDTDLNKKNRNDIYQVEPTKTVKGCCPPNLESETLYSGENEKTDVDLLRISNQLGSSRVEDLTDDSWKPLNNKLVHDWAADWSDVPEISVEWNKYSKESSERIAATPSETDNAGKPINSDKMYKSVSEVHSSKQLVYSDKISEASPKENSTKELKSSDNKLCETLSVELNSGKLMNSDKMYETTSGEDLECQNEIIQTTLVNGLVIEMNCIKEVEMQHANELSLNQIECNGEINFFNSEPLIFENSKFHGAGTAKKSCSLETGTSNQKCTLLEAQKKAKNSEFGQHGQNFSIVSVELNVSPESNSEISPSCSFPVLTTRSEEMENESESSQKISLCEKRNSELVLKLLDPDASSSNVSEDGGWLTVSEEDDEMSGNGNHNNEIHSKK